jgi:hypothetical protein
VTVGELAPKVVTAVVEIPKGSKLKDELDKDSGLLSLTVCFLVASITQPIMGSFGPVAEAHQVVEQALKFYQQEKKKLKGS